MRLTRATPLPVLTLDLDSPHDVAELAELYRPARADWLRINLVQSLNGAIVGVDGTSDSLSNAIDRKILGIIRKHADVILVGASTVRAEGHVLPRGRDLAVVTGSGDLAGHNFTAEEGRGRLLVLYPASNEQEVVANLAGLQAVLVPLKGVAGSPSSPGDMVVALRGLGYRSIVCEGGRSLATQFIDSGVVDELCLTIAPVLAGNSALGLTANSPGGARLEPGHLLIDDAGVLYSRFTLASRGA